MDSRWTMGAMASKKAGPSSPSLRRMDSDRESEVSGPVATIPGPEGNSGHSWRTISIAGRAWTAAVMPRANTSRSTARAEPAATRAGSAEASRIEPSAAISRFNCPWALAGSSLLNDFVQTSSPSRSVW